jgi:hypothetical protein
MKIRGILARLYHGRSTNDYCLPKKNNIYMKNQEIKIQYISEKSRNQNMLTQLTNVVAERANAKRNTDGTSTIGQAKRAQ